MLIPGMERIVKLDNNYNVISNPKDQDQNLTLNQNPVRVLKFIDQCQDTICTIDQIEQRNLSSGTYHMIDRFDPTHRLKGTVWPCQLIVSDSVDLNDLKYLIICVGGVVIWRIPLQLIISLFPPLKINSQYQINLPKSYFFNSSFRCKITDWVDGSFEPILCKFTDLMDRYELHGIPLFMYEYHETLIQLVAYGQELVSISESSYNPIKFDLNFETMYLGEKSLDLFSYPISPTPSLFNSVNLIHGIDIHRSTWALRPTWYHRCCENIKMYFADNSLSDMELFIGHIFRNKPQNKRFIDIYSELKKIKAQNIYNMLPLDCPYPLCQIIGEYMDNSHKGSYAEILSDQTIRLHLYMKNKFIAYSGMGGVRILHCYQSQKNMYDQNYRDSWE
jgi:hypothetical protein